VCLCVQLRASVPALLCRLRLSHGPVRVCGTPRRLCVLVPEVAGRQEDKEEELRGPPARAAFKDGKPTKVRGCRHVSVCKAGRISELNIVR
jgi:glycyl-tRNA synthetase beta subunit